jgi:hypothetical protein
LLFGVGVGRGAVHPLHAGHHLRREGHLLGTDLAVLVGVQHGEGPIGHAARDLREEGSELVRGQGTVPVGVVPGVESGDARLDNQVSRLRRKIEDDPVHPRIIATIRSGGYSLAADVREAN